MGKVSSLIALSALVGTSLSLTSAAEGRRPALRFNFPKRAPGRAGIRIGQRPVYVNPAKLLKSPYGFVVQYRKFVRIGHYFKKPKARHNGINTYNYFGLFGGRAKLELWPTRESWSNKQSKPAVTVNDAEVRVVLSLENMGPSAQTNWLRDSVAACVNQATSANGKAGLFRITAGGKASVQHQGADVIQIDVPMNSLEVASMRCEFRPATTTARAMRVGR